MLSKLTYHVYYYLVIRQFFIMYFVDSSSIITTTQIVVISIVGSIGALAIIIWKAYVAYSNSVQNR